MPLESKMIPMGAKTFYTEKWYKVVLDHKKPLMQSEQTQVIEVTPTAAEHYTGNLMRFLQTQGIAQKYHAAIALINGLDLNTRFSENIKTMIIPDLSYLDKLNRQISGIN